MKKNKAKVTALVIAVIIIVIVVCTAWAIWNGHESNEPVEITILHTNDIHGNASGDEKGVIGVAKLVTYLNELRANQDNILVLDAGDLFQGLPFANLEKGQSMISLANAIGYDAMTVGNHEFDFGADNLFEIVGQLNYPVIAANIYGEDGNRAFTPYIVKELDGVKVGIFGMATPETAFKTHPQNVAGYTFANIIEEAEQNVEVLRNQEQVDVVIMLAH